MLRGVHPHVSGPLKYPVQRAPAADQAEPAEQRSHQRSAAGHLCTSMEMMGGMGMMVN